MQDEKYLAKLRTHWKRNTVFPPRAKLCDVVGLSSTSSVFALVGRLTDAGYLERQDGRIATTKKFFARTILGPVRAGLAQPVSQEEPGLVTVNDYLIDEPNRTSMHRVRGDSMQDARIVDGDLPAVERNAPTKPGDIVLACVDNELTVKTLRLDPEGRWYSSPPILPIRSLKIGCSRFASLRRCNRHWKDACLIPSLDSTSLASGRAANGRHQNTRPVQGIDAPLRLKRTLWLLANSMRLLKA